MELSLKSWFLPLLLLLLLAPAPSFQLHDLAHKGELLPSSTSLIKTEPISSVSKRGGGHGGGHGGGGHGGHSGGGRGGRGGEIPLYAAGAAGAGAQGHHHNGAVVNRGPPSSRANLGTAVVLGLAMVCKHFA